MHEREGRVENKGEAEERAYRSEHLRIEADKLIRQKQMAEELGLKEEAKSKGFNAVRERQMAHLIEVIPSSSDISEKHPSGKLPESSLAREERFLEEDLAWLRLPAIEHQVPPDKQGLLHDMIWDRKQRLEQVQKARLAEAKDRPDAAEAGVGQK